MTDEISRLPINLDNYEKMYKLIVNLKEENHSIK